MSQFHESLPSAGSSVALVLGGGGAAGNAWEIGIIAGLAEAGLDMTQAADLVIGTSAGATTAAQVRSGIPAAELLTSVLSPPAQPTGQRREQSPSLPMALVPTVSINGARYIDGGVRSADNADLASGYGCVVVLSPLGGRSGTPPEAGRFEGLRPCRFRPGQAGSETHDGLTCRL